jgi:hypothetical protein
VKEMKSKLTKRRKNNISFLIRFFVFYLHNLPNLANIMFHGVGFNSQTTDRGGVNDRTGRMPISVVQSGSTSTCGNCHVFLKVC